MSKGKSRERTARREAERDAMRARLDAARARERVERLSAGGAADWPITVESSVLIERRAQALPCVHCNGALEVIAHDTAVVDDARRRIVETKCRACGARRKLWFAIVEPLEN